MPEINNFTAEDKQEAIEEYKKIKTNKESIEKIYKMGANGVLILSVMCICIALVFLIMWLGKHTADRIELCVVSMVMSVIMFIIYLVKKNKKYSNLENIEREMQLRKQKLIEMGTNEEEL